MISDVEYYKLLEDNYKFYFLVSNTCEDKNQTIYTVGQCKHSKSIIEGNIHASWIVLFFMAVVIIGTAILCWRELCNK